MLAVLWVVDSAVLMVVSMEFSSVDQMDEKLAVATVVETVDLWVVERVAQ